MCYIFSAYIWVISPDFNLLQIQVIAAQITNGHCIYEGASSAVSDVGCNIMIRKLIISIFNILGGPYEIQTYLHWIPFRMVAYTRCEVPCLARRTHGLHRGQTPMLLGQPGVRNTLLFACAQRCVLNTPIKYDRPSFILMKKITDITVTLWA
jgi:hypothetical protein